MPKPEKQSNAKQAAALIETARESGIDPDRSAVAAHAWREVPGIVEDLLQYAGPARTARVPELLARVWRMVSSGRVPPVVRDAVRSAAEAFH